MMKTLDQRIALVTGGSRGIGAAIAKSLARHGAVVALTYHKSESPALNVVSHIRSSGGHAEAFYADQSKESDVIDLIRSVVQKFGRIDVLVNNAGIYEGNFIHETTTDQFDRIVDVNIKAVYLAIRESVPHMKPGASIINIGSVLGERAQRADVSLYAMSKFAVAGLTRGAAHDLSPLGIRINCIQPGAINTDMNPEVSDFSESWRQITPMKRHGQPDEIGSVASFLASSDSSFMTGACINVDGGCNA